MWNAYAKLDRLSAALKTRGLNPKRLDITDLFATLQRRGVTDRVLNSLTWELIALLEPPGCEMSHYKLYGGQAAVNNCIEGRTPGRCPILREYRKRKTAREEKEKDAVPAQAPTEGLSPNIPNEARNES